MDLLPQIQMFQDNYNRIMSNGHSRLSEDIPTFMFCLSLPYSYKSTAQQYLDNITAITNYKVTDIITWVLQEESRQKAQALGQGLSLNKFSTMMNFGQKCAKCGKTNHTTQNHWPGGKIWTKGQGTTKDPKIVKFIWKEEVRQKGEGQRKGTNECQCIKCTGIGWFVYTNSTIN